MNKKDKKQLRILQNVAIAVSIVLMIVVVIMDLTTTFWAETVILSGIAAGLLTFVLTATFVERWMAQREQQKWAPVTALALTDILHSLADDEESDLRRGYVQVRTLSAPKEQTRQAYDDLLHAVVTERDLLTHRLSLWASFLVDSSDVQTLLTHIATVGQTLDNLRDAIVESETMGLEHREGHNEVSAQVQNYNDAAIAVASEIETVLESLQSQ